jgi:hypothetical protein
VLVSVDFQRWVGVEEAAAHSYLNRPAIDGGQQVPAPAGTRGWAPTHSDGVFVGKEAGLEDDGSGEASDGQRFSAHEPR